MHIITLWQIHRELANENVRMELEESLDCVFELCDDVFCLGNNSFTS